MGATICKSQSKTKLTKSDYRFLTAQTGLSRTDIKYAFNDYLIKNRKQGDNDTDYRSIFLDNYIELLT